MTSGPEVTSPAKIAYEIASGGHMRYINMADGLIIPVWRLNLSFASDM